MEAGSRCGSHPAPCHKSVQGGKVCQKGDQDEEHLNHSLTSVKVLIVYASVQERWREEEEEDKHTS